MRLPIALQPKWGLAILRIVVGVTFVMHGWQKYAGGVDGTAGFFGSLGIPAPAVMASIVIALEVLGGIALILGLGSRWVSLLLAGDMLTAMLTFHLPNGFFVQDGGYELVLLLLAGALTLFLSGGGALALENVLGYRAGQRQAVRGA